MKVLDKSDPHKGSKNVEDLDCGRLEPEIKQDRYSPYYKPPIYLIIMDKYY